MSDIASLYLPCRAGIGHLSARPTRQGEKAIALETAQTLSGTLRNALFAYAMTGSAVASLVIIAAPHLSVLLHCIFHGRG
jgi:hypothetical protein